MVSFNTLLLSLTAVAGVFSVPTPEAKELITRQTLTTSQTGTSNGYYYSFWTDGTAKVQYTNGAAGRYTVDWSGNVGNWVGGKGWATGSAR